MCKCCSKYVDFVLKHHAQNVDVMLKGRNIHTCSRYVHIWSNSELYNVVSTVQDNSSWSTHIDNICSKAKHSSSLTWLYPAGLYPNVPTICLNSYMHSFLPTALFQTGILYLTVSLSYISGLCAPAEEQKEVQENMFTLNSESAV